MQESGRFAGLFTKVCVVLVCLGGLQLIVALFFYLAESPTKLTKYLVISQTLVPYDNATDVNKRIYSSASVIKDAEENHTSCPETSPLLVGPMRVEFSEILTLDLIRKENPQLVMGGRYKPSDCVALQKVALIIPFRNRDEHLKHWLHYLHPILQRQQLDYGIYIIEQVGEDTFNRAKLLNVGYVEALKEYDYDCFIFSDVDIIPMDDRNTYKCSSQPRHLSVSMDKFGFRLPYSQYFGGVSAMSKQQFEKINGFPNNYWGWGGEDDDIFNRCRCDNNLHPPHHHQDGSVHTSKGGSAAPLPSSSGRNMLIRYPRIINYGRGLCQNFIMLAGLSINVCFIHHSISRVFLVEI
ncbi:beta-1,4-galactosyltransferase 1 isoform X1 [Pseudorasbora parva]|uniref:beta-1,4-galactosyltransferase 1 isoform X1 n=1 Tax=Pseudorasbora parva TaxID=51549 RepID=UPI00351F0F06